jgi:hypothetical protein
VFCFTNLNRLAADFEKRSKKYINSQGDKYVQIIEE